MPVPNKAIIDSLVETIKQKVEPPKLYDILQKTNQNIGKIYDALFIGPLPPNDGSALDLTKLARTSLPPGIAFVDVSNVFIQNQQIFCNPRPTLELVDSGTPAIKTRIQTSTPFGLFSHNLYHDGAAFQTDSGDGAGITFNSSANIVLRQKIGGILFNTIQITNNRIIQLGTPTSVVGAAAQDIVLETSKAIRSPNAAATKALSMISIDANDMVQLGSKSSGDTLPNGAPSIPTPVSGDLPPANANNNGMILIDKTNHRICWWDSGNRYFAAGTAF